MASLITESLLATTLIDAKQSSIKITSIELDNDALISPISVEHEERLPLGFLDLPSEIRLEIYSYLFAESKISHGVPHAPLPLNDRKICSCQFPDQLVRTCRQIRQEALPLLLSATTVEANSTFEGIGCVPEGYLSYVKRAVILDTKAFSTQLLQPASDIALSSWANLRVLELGDVTVWCKFYDEVFLQSPQADEPMCTIALFNLKRINPVLLNWVMEPKHFNIHLFCRFVMNSLSDETIYAVIDVDGRRVLRKTKGPPMKSFNSWSGYY